MQALPPPIFFTLSPCRDTHRLISICNIFYFQPLNYLDSDINLVSQHFCGCPWKSLSVCLFSFPLCNTISSHSMCPSIRRILDIPDGALCNTWTVDKLRFSFQWYPNCLLYKVVSKIMPQVCSTSLLAMSVVRSSTKRTILISFSQPPHAPQNLTINSKAQKVSNMILEKKWKLILCLRKHSKPTNWCCWPFHRLLPIYPIQLRHSLHSRYCWSMFTMQR